jgi:hypothetical protein
MILTNTCTTHNSIHSVLRGIHHLDTYISPVFDADGKLKRIIVNNNDITESVTLRQTLEEYAFKMKYILKTSGVMTWVYNPDTHTNTLSGEMEDKIQDMSGGELINNVSESDRELVADCVHKMDNREIDTFSIKVEFKRVFDSEGQFFLYSRRHTIPRQRKQNTLLHRTRHQHHRLDRKPRTSSSMKRKKHKKAGPSEIGFPLPMSAMKSVRR